MNNPSTIAILLLVIGAFLCGLHSAIRNSIITSAVGIILLSVAILISVVGH